MSFFKRKTIKIELEGRDQSIELVPIPMSCHAGFTKDFTEFADKAATATKSGDKKAMELAYSDIAELLATYIVGATKEDILDKDNGLDMEDIGFLAGRLFKISDSPKV